MPGQSSKVPALTYYVEEIYGGNFDVVTKKVSVGITATKIVNTDYERVALIIVLLSTNDTYISFDNGVSTSEGIELSTSGASISENAVDDLVMPGQEHWGIAASGTSNLYVIEIKRYVTNP